MKIHRHPEDWLLLGLATVCLVLAYVFVRVGSEVLEGKLSGIDGAVRDFVLAHQSSAVKRFFEVLAWLGAKSVLIVASLAIGWVLTRRVGTLILIVACAVVAAEFVDVLKAGFGVTRPAGGQLVRRSLSFPSGHASGTMAIATLLTYVAVRERRFAWPVMLVSGVVVVLVAASRIYLDMHWASDVAGGLLIGATLGVAGSAIYELARRRGQPSRNAPGIPADA